MAYYGISMSYVCSCPDVIHRVYKRHTHSFRMELRRSESIFKEFSHNFKVRKAPIYLYICVILFHNFHTCLCHCGQMMYCIKSLARYISIYRISRKFNHLFHEQQVELRLAKHMKKLNVTGGTVCFLLKNANPNLIWQ